MKRYENHKRTLRNLLTRIDTDLKQNQNKVHECFDNLHTENLIRQQELSLEYRRLFSLKSDLHSALYEIEANEKSFQENNKRELDWIQTERIKLEARKKLYGDI